ncbi:hypothetical protein A2803_01800 [Candidatus Woesebacteria bacterium RIFCSPHIGHO2_01_FULL_44_21]|uniref:Lactamase n=1 Tax=Candidatus Woesebacteria bacterium RIFCSPHIGHO2_01_FULL_44_21 TaxID=1802503 RepID=A0A1F7YW96_9BACT|nr:MAG: hypothetical protein A2803_01800 [Candidatus Woesebacteria bacterium RIFCSPHIGHO2_01_FULL_44_21]OGM69606.1 MAG: hypothetical protein A2897_03315 [Candidatus Woesebacteria bacterium RIFCSPLOWO2_01_FULL_44_24b]
MDVIFLGHSSFHIKGKDASIVTDPFSPETVGIRFPKVSATIVTVSHDHDDHNAASLVEDARKVIAGPGEYEIDGISILGISSFHDDKKGAERGKNTIYVFEIDGFRVAHLGDLGHRLADEAVEDIGDVDILMIPVGGGYTIGPKEAAEVARAIEPKVIIPMHYQMPGLNPVVFSALVDEKPFVAEVGLSARIEKKLSLKAGTLSEDSQEIVILDIS